MQAIITIIQVKMGDAASYNLSLDSGVLGIDGCVQMIKKQLKLKKSGWQKIIVK